MDNAQFFSLFNRQFVINAKKALLCCPRCRNKFSYAFDRNDRRRPFLLPCGHDLCESCCSQNNRHILKCSVCSTSINLLSLQPRRQNRFSIRKCLDLNFFLMGEINHVQYFKSQEIKSPLKTETTSEQQCMECEKVPAEGKCQSCKAYMCRSCFNQVHCSAKTLKNHGWMPMDKIINKFDLSTPIYCYLHNRYCNCFCNQCCITCCSQCVDVDHRNHDWTTTQEMNNELLDQIGPVLNTLNNACESVKQAQKEIKYVENKLREYALKTVEDISNYFRYLHNFLQNEEKRLMKNFMELSQLPQKNLRQAFQTFVDSQEILHQMRNNLEIYRNTSPRNAYLRNILDMYKKQLHHTPCRLTISKLEENPYKFEIHRDILKDMPKYYTSNFQDLNIRISISTLNEVSNFINSDSNESLETSVESNAMEVIERRDNVSSVSPPSCLMSFDKQSDTSGKQTSNAEDFKKYENVIVHNNDKDSTTSSCINSKGTIDDNNNKTQEFPGEIAFNFFRDTISRTEMSTSTSSFYGEELVKVTYITAPDDFYVQIIDVYKQVKEIYSSYRNDGRLDLMPQIISESHYYMIYHNQDMQWYRAKVKKILTNNRCEVFLIDFGIHIEVNKDCIYNIEYKHLQIPLAAIQCSLNDLIPPNGSEWTEDAKLFLMEILQNKSAFLTKITKTKDDLYIVDLHNHLTKSVRESFLYTGLALDNSIIGKVQKKTICPDIPKCVFQIGELLKVIITHIESPEEFYIVKCGLVQELEEFTKSLNNYYNHLNTNLQQLYLGYPQTNCVICVHKIWCRATIEEVKENGKILVRFVDSGKTKVICWRDVYVLSKEFKAVEEFAVQCALADIQPFQVNGYMYTTKAINYFKQMAANPNLYIEILDNEKNQHKVILHINRSKLDINVGAFLVKYGHGISTGQATQVEVIRKKVDRESDKCDNYATDTNTGEYKTDNNKLQRSAIVISHIINPGEFYVQLIELLNGVKTFHEKLQEIHNLKYQQLLEQKYCSHEWQVGDNCIVYIKYVNNHLNDEKENSQNQNSKHEWYRGVIKGIEKSFNTKYEVFLRDIGDTIHSVLKNQIYAIDDQIDRVANAAHRCHLACITSCIADRWPKTAIDFFKNSFKKFELLFATLKGKPSPETQSFPIFLWGVSTQASGPLSPCIKNYTTVNQILIDAGLACMLEPFDAIEQLIISDKENQMTLAEWLQINTETFEEHNDDTIKRICGDNTSESIEYSFEKDEKGLNDVPTTGQTKPPSAWLTYRLINKTIFTGYPTYVDHNGTVCIQDVLDLKMAEILCNNLGEAYGNIPQPPLDYKYSIGQACVATYKSKNTNKLYRCIVIDNGNNKNEWHLYYIDYGNIEHVCAEYMRPYAPYPNFPALINKFRIKGNKPKNIKYSTAALDFIHSKIVARYVTVCVIDSKTFENSLEKIRMCSIYCGSINIKDYAIREGYVNPEENLQIAEYNDDIALFMDIDDDGIAFNKSFICEEEEEDEKALEKAFENFHNLLKQITTYSNNKDTNVESLEESITKFHWNNDEMPTIDNSGNNVNRSQYYQEPLEDQYGDSSALNGDDHPMLEIIEDFETQLKNEKGNYTQECGTSKQKSFENEVYAELQERREITSELASEVDEDLDIDDDGIAFNKSFICEEEEEDEKALEKAFENFHNLLKQITTYSNNKDTNVESLEESITKFHWNNDEMPTIDNSGNIANRSQYYQEPLEDQYGDSSALNGDDHPMLEIIEDFETQLKNEKGNYTQECGTSKQKSFENVVYAELQERREITSELASEVDEDLESEFDQFSPIATSSTNTHISCLNYFKQSHLPSNLNYINCRVKSVLTPTVLQIAPLNEEFILCRRKLRKKIKEMIDTLPQLETVKVGQKCLACLSKNNKWYRAVICTYYNISKMAQVIYVDNLYSETLPLHKLKELPEELTHYPLLTLRVKLCNVKCNPLMNEKEIRLAVEKCLLRRKFVARIVKNQQNTSFDTKNLINEGVCFSKDFLPSFIINNNQCEQNLLEISLYNLTNKFCAYKSLIKKQYFLLK